MQARPAPMALVGIALAMPLIGILTPHAASQESTGPATRLQQCIATLRSDLHANPDRIGTRLLLCSQLRASGRSEEALAVASQPVPQDPVAAGHLRLMMAQCHEDSGRSAEARAAFAQARDVASVRACALLRQAVMEARNGDLSTARNALAEAVKLKPPSPEACFLAYRLSLTEQEAESALMQLVSSEAAGYWAEQAAQLRVERRSR